MGGAWSRDGVIVFGSGARKGLFRIAAAGGAVFPLTTPARTTSFGSLASMRFFSSCTGIRDSPRSNPLYFCPAMAGAASKTVAATENTALPALITFLPRPAV